jgi:hypothetical protein
MFRFADSRLGRRLSLTLLGSLLLACLGTSAGTAYVLRCSVFDYMDRFSANPRNPSEQYLFACGYVWHSTNNGGLWNRVDPTGLPVGVRDGYIATNGQPGHLYLGILTITRSSWQCWDCAWKNLRPAIYISDDGGHTWALSYKFKQGSAADGGFIGLYAHPSKDRFLYAVIKNADEITFYASGTAGQFWKPICLEYYDIGRVCELPKAVMDFENALIPAQQ